MTNCYAYAINNHYIPGTTSFYYKQQPGQYYGNSIIAPYNKDDLENAIENDFNKYNLQYNTHLIFKKVSRFEICPIGTYKIAIVRYDGDYHFYRQNTDGTWSHKPGTSEVRNTDFSAERNIIYDPEYSDRGFYDDFIGFYAVTPWGGLYENS